MPWPDLGGGGLVRVPAGKHEVGTVVVGQTATITGESQNDTHLIGTVVVRAAHTKLADLRVVGELRYEGIGVTGLNLSHCSLDNVVVAGPTVLDDAIIFLATNCVFMRAPVGLAVRRVRGGSNAVRLVGCQVSGNEVGLRAVRVASLTVDGCTMEANRRAIEAEGVANLAVRDLHLEDGTSGPGPAVDLVTCIGLAIEGGYFLASRPRDECARLRNCPQARLVGNRWHGYRLPLALDSRCRDSFGVANFTGGPARPSLWDGTRWVAVGAAP